MVSLPIPTAVPMAGQKQLICRDVTMCLPRDDVRGRQVRAWLLGTVCGVIGGQWGSVLSPSPRLSLRTKSGAQRAVIELARDG